MSKWFNKIDSKVVYVDFGGKVRVQKTVEAVEKAFPYFNPDTVTEEAKDRL